MSKPVPPPEQVLDQLERGEHFWRRARAERLAFLVDGADYFETLARAIDQAEHQILIAGWDLAGDLVLVERDGGPVEEGSPRTLRGRIERRLQARPELVVRALIWDRTLPFYLVEGRFWHSISLAWKTSPRFMIHYDSLHSVGASHHQKAVVIDDRLAFVGGIDLTTRRWDTLRHVPDDPRRCSPGGKHYIPFHDMMAMFDGEAAAAIGDLIRGRWMYATGEWIRRPTPRASARWVEGVEPTLKDTTLTIARTYVQPESPEVCEIRSAVQVLLRSARRYIYMENQYLTDPCVVDALAARLKDPDGPEVVIVLPRQSMGWLEQQVMDTLRARAIERLLETGAGQRLRVYYPASGDAASPTGIYVHAKLYICDGERMMLGSANACQRSLGFDTELAVLLGDGAAERDAVHDLLARLLGEHLDASTRAARAALARGETPRQIIDAHNGHAGRRLEPLDWHVNSVSRALIPDSADTKREPMAIGWIVRWLAERGAKPLARPSEVGAAVLIALALAAAAACLWPEVSAPWTGRAAALITDAGWGWWLALALLAAPLSLSALGTVVVMLGFGALGGGVTGPALALLASALIWGALLGFGRAVREKRSLWSWSRRVNLLARFACGRELAALCGAILASRVGAGSVALAMGGVRRARCGPAEEGDPRRARGAMARQPRRRDPLLVWLGGAAPMTLLTSSAGALSVAAWQTGRWVWAGALAAVITLLFALGLGLGRRVERARAQLTIDFNDQPPEDLAARLDQQPAPALSDRPDASPARAPALERA